MPTPPTGLSTVVQVPAGANLQTAIDAAQPGTTLQLATGATYTGNFVLDEDVLREEGMTDFDQYRYDPSESLEVDIFVERSAP